MNVRTRSVTQTRAVAHALASVLRAGDVVVLSGDLGAGKTAFVQGACAALGVVDPVTSPTFTIMHEYHAPVPVLHVDLYRIDTVNELHDLGFDEIVDGDHITFIEWGDRFAAALPPDHVVIELELPPAGDGGAADAEVDDRSADDRIVRVHAHGSGWHTRSRSIATSLAHYLHPDTGEG